MSQTLIYNLKMDISLYIAQLEAFDKAIASAAFADLPEDQKASRLRARGYLAGYLAEAIEDLKELETSLNG